MNDVQRRTSAAGAVLDRTRDRIDAMRVALDRANLGGDDLYAEAVALEKKVELLNERLRGDRLRGGMKGVGIEHSINDRLGVGRSATWGGTYGPTRQQREQLDLGLRMFEEWRAELKAVVESDVPALEAKLDAAQVPWTAGRDW